MSYAPRFHMPGTYQFETSPSSPHLSAGLFRPPSSPSASNSVINLAKSASDNLYTDAAPAGPTTTPPPPFDPARKRVRGGADTNTPRSATPLQEWTVTGPGDARPGAYADGACDPGSPALGPDSEDGRKGQQIRYTLAGQIDAPSGRASCFPAEATTMEDSAYSDVEYRRALGSKRTRDELDSPAAAPANLPLENPQGARPPPNSSGWSGFALNTLGGVVGKVWQFCKTGAFRGFYAGGGKGYDVNPKSPASASATDAWAVNRAGGKIWCNEHDVPTLPSSHVVPFSNGYAPTGLTPRQDHILSMPDCLEAGSPQPSPTPAAKRRQVGQAGDELGRNWVIVDEPRARAQAQSGSRHLVTATPAPRPGMRRVSPRFAVPTVPSERPINIPVSRLGTATPGTPKEPSMPVSHAGSPSLAPREPASYARQRSPDAKAAQPFTPDSTPDGGRGAFPSQLPGPGPNPFAYTNPHSYDQCPNPFVHPVGQSPSPFTGAPGRGPGKRPGPNPFARGGSRPNKWPSPQSSSLRRHQSSASTASTLRRGISGRDSGDLTESPRLDAEAKHLASRHLNAERSADARMEMFNTRLMEMIRQGKEALGTTVEVDGDGDGVWLDDE